MGTEENDSDRLILNDTGMTDEELFQHLADMTEQVIRLQARLDEVEDRKLQDSADALTSFYRAGGVVTLSEWRALSVEERGLYADAKKVVDQENWCKAVQILRPGDLSAFMPIMESTEERASIISELAIRAELEKRNHEPVR